jgi:hypothetical protein
MDSMMSGMGAMMAWMMGVSLLAWVLVVGLLVALLFGLVRLFSAAQSKGDDRATRTKP